MSGERLRVPAGLTVIVGGARSGKSSLAVRLGEAFDGAITFVATATAGDDDMAARIGRHKAERPVEWTTIESPMLDAALPDEGLVIVDCITMWATNAMLGGVVDLGAVAGRLAAGWAARSGPTVVVTNEVGMGVVPPTELGRRFQDELGRVNAAVVARAQLAVLVVAGRVVPLSTAAEAFA